MALYEHESILCASSVCQRESSFCKCEGVLHECKRVLFGKMKTFGGIWVFHANEPASYVNARAFCAVVSFLCKRVCFMWMWKHFIWTSRAICESENILYEWESILYQFVSVFLSVREFCGQNFADRCPLRVNYR